MSRDSKTCWYHRDLTRDKADDLLKSAQKDGTFLVRESLTSKGDYVLSILYNDEVFHYQIRRHGEDAFFSIDDQTPIHGLDSLIEHYQKSPDGLVTDLLSCIPNEPPPAEARRHGRTNLLHRATQNGSLFVVEQKLDAGNKTYPLDAKDEDGRSVVHLACLLDMENNAVPILEKLISHGANVNCRDESGNTPLHYACRNKPLSFIQMLVNVKAHIDARNNDTGRVPLHEAAHNGNLEVVMYLLDLGVPHMPRCCERKTPAQLAKEAGHIKTAEYLEQYKPPPSTTNTTLWYHGTLDRAETEKVIRKYAKSFPIPKDAHGTFLVRFSQRESTYILGLLNEENEVKNYVIQKSPHHYYFIDEGPFMVSLEHLVQHYMRFSDGLPVKLRHPVQPLPKPQLPPPPSNVALTLPPPQKKTKEADSLATSPETKERIPLQSDESLNKGSSSSFSSTLPMPSKFDSWKKNLFGMKNKENKSKSKEINENVDTISLKDNISKSLEVVEFSNDDIYKVPSSIPATDMMPNRPSNNKNPNIQNITDDLELFTQSDRFCGSSIHEKDNSIEEIYFVEAPVKSVQFRYIPFEQKPYFPRATDTTIADGNTSNGYTAHNNKSNVSMGNRSDRVLSVESSISNDFDTMLKFQNANRGLAMTPNIEANTLKPHFYIPYTSIELSEILGQGEFGNVFKGVMKCESHKGESEEIPVAVKTLQNEHVKENKLAFLREASVMIKLSHYCIVKMIGISKGPKGLMIIQELVSPGSMEVYLREHQDTIEPNIELKIWASQIACGMHYLQCHNFVHRDLAARNILLSSRHQAKISDFGFSRALGVGSDYYKAYSGGKWPIKWYAIESISFGTFSHASDVWSFGVTLWEMYSFGLTPYQNWDSHKVMEQIERGYRLPKPQMCPSNVYEIMNNCWNYDPKNRPTFRYLTDFFSSDLDYQNIVDLIKTQNVF